MIFSQNKRLYNSLDGFETPFELLQDDVAIHRYIQRRKESYATVVFIVSAYAKQNR